MTDTVNVITYETLFEDVLQDRLDHPTTWKEMCDVTITDTRVISSSYVSSGLSSPSTVTRGTGHDLTLYQETAETLTISTGRDLGIFMDWGDLAQSPWSKPGEIFDRIGAILNEYVEGAVLAEHAEWTDFDNASIGGSAGNITVSASNVDNIIRGVKREIREGNGGSAMNARGVGFVWRAADFELLEAFTQANGGGAMNEGFLKNGTVEGLRYLGADHYWSNEHTANHVFAGVKKTQRLGILRGTYGRAHTIDFPGSSENNFLSGQAYYSRIDIGLLHPTAHNALSYDVNVA